MSQGKNPTTERILALYQSGIRSYATLAAESGASSCRVVDGVLLRARASGVLPPVTHVCATLRPRVGELWEAGLTYSQIAARVGISRGAVGRLLMELRDKGVMLRHDRA